MCVFTSPTYSETIRRVRKQYTFTDCECSEALLSLDVLPGDFVSGKLNEFSPCSAEIKLCVPIIINKIKKKHHGAEKGKILSFF